MNRLTLSFWLFLTAAILSGGLLGRYLAALTKGLADGSTLALTPILATAFLFSAIVLVRIVRAAARRPTRQLAPPPERTPQP